jgi:predicted acylesterase/phospholipase RssA
MITEKCLTIVTYNLTKNKTEYINYLSHPDLSCIDAIILSITIPIIFWMSKMNDSIYIDGAFGDPYPVLLRDNGINKIIGIYIKTINEEKNYKNPLIYIHDILHCAFHITTERNVIESSDNCLNISISSSIMDTIGTTLSIKDKANMVLEGIKQGNIFMESIDDI